MKGNWVFLILFTIPGSSFGVVIRFSEKGRNEWTDGGDKTGAGEGSERTQCRSYGDTQPVLSVHLLTSHDPEPQLSPSLSSRPYPGFLT